MFNFSKNNNLNTINLDKLVIDKHKYIKEQNRLMDKYIEFKCRHFKFVFLCVNSFENRYLLQLAKLHESDKLKNIKYFVDDCLEKNISIKKYTEYELLCARYKYVSLLFEKYNIKSEYVVDNGLHISITNQYYKNENNEKFESANI